MAEATEERNPSKPTGVEAKSSITLDIRDMYKFEPEDLTVDIPITHYSNVAYMQVTSREVIIDFLQLPGIKRDEKMVVSGIRVYMSHSAAQKLAINLEALIEQSYKNGKFEPFELPESRDVELTTKIDRPSEEGHT